MGLNGLLGVRLVQLVRPLLVVFILRVINFETAAQYVALLGIYVIALEAYNIIAPSDRLYMSESGISDLRLILKRRLQAAALIAPASAVTIAIGLALPWTVACAITTTALANAFATAAGSYFYGRADLTPLCLAEALSWLLQLAAVLLMLIGGQIVFGFIVYSLDQLLRVAVLSLLASRAALSERGIHNDAPRALVPLAFEGAILTVSNHIHRLPFVISPGVVDPAFVIAAQVSGAVYNVLMGISARKQVTPRYRLYLIGMLVAIGSFGAAQMVSASWVRISVQTGVLCVLAVLHGAVMTRLPGASGVIASRRSRVVIVCGFLMVIIVGSFLSPLAFLGSPVVLALAAMASVRTPNEKI